MWQTKRTQLIWFFLKFQKHKLPEVDMTTQLAIESGMGIATKNFLGIFSSLGIVVQLQIRFVHVNLYI